MNPENESSDSGNVSPPVPPRLPKRNPYSVNEEFAKTISSELNSRLSVLKKNGPEVVTPSKISETQYDVTTPPPVPPRRDNLSINYDSDDDIIGNYENESADKEDSVNNKAVENEDENEEEKMELEENDDDNNYETNSESDALERKSKSKEEILNEKLEDLAEENSELMETLRENKRALKGKKEDVKKLKTENKKLLNEISELKEKNKEELQKLNEKIQDLTEKSKELEEKNKNLLAENETLKSKLEEMSKMKTEEPKENDQINNETSSISDKTETSEKVERSIPAIPPKPSRKVCKSMIQNATLDKNEYDLEPITPSKKSTSNEEVTNTSSSESIELLPGTSSRPLVLPTKTCVRKRGVNRNSSLPSDKKASKKITSGNMMEEPMNIDDSDTNLANNERKSSLKQHNTSSEESPKTTSRPALPPRASGRKEKAPSVDNDELKLRLEKIKKPVRQDSPVPQMILKNELINPPKKTSYIYEVSTIDSVDSVNSKTSSEEAIDTIKDRVDSSNSKIDRTNSISQHSIKQNTLDDHESDDNRSPVVPKRVEKRMSHRSEIESNDDSSSHRYSQRQSYSSQDIEVNSIHEKKERNEDEDYEKNIAEENEENEGEESNNEATPVEPEINPTLSKIHRIGRGIPSLLPEGGLSNIKLRSRKEDNHSSRQGVVENLSEDELKKWIFATIGKDEKEGDLFTVLHDGITLCELINSIRKDKQISAKSGRMRAWHIVNINAYLSGCIDLQIKTSFKAEDLYEGEGLDKIIQNLSELKYYYDNRKK